jgi:Phytanoyl-CoA dioxygenase (PhyH)
MTVITPESRAAFREQGYVVIPNVLDQSAIEHGRSLVATMLEREPPPEGHVGVHFLWPGFGPAGHPLLDFYQATGVGDVAAELLRPDLGPEQPDFAQVATTIPPWPHRPGSPHLDGLTPLPEDGRPGTFSLLAGVWLTDQLGLHQGNLWVWPGTHLRSGQYLAEHGADALTRVDELDGGCPYPRVELGEPVQARGKAGSVLFAHYLLAHNIGGHDGPAEMGRRETIYYRLHAEDHRHRWREVVTDPLSEFRG